MLVQLPRQLRAALCALGDYTALKEFLERPTGMPYNPDDIDNLHACLLSMAALSEDLHPVVLVPCDTLLTCLFVKLEKLRMGHTCLLFMPGLCENLQRLSFVSCPALSCLEA